MVGSVVVSVALATGRQLTWKLGAVAAIGLAVMAVWGVPWASAAVTGYALGGNWDDQILGGSEAVRDASAGGATGALCGAIVGTAVARLFRGNVEGRDNPHALSL